MRSSGPETPAFPELGLRSRGDFKPVPALEEVTSSQEDRQQRAQSAWPQFTCLQHFAAFEAPLPGSSQEPVGGLIGAAGWGLPLR